MKNKRVALVRADTHGYYFGMMMDDCDPLLLQKYNYVVHHYASHIYSAEVLTMPRVPGFELAKVYDYDIEKARQMSETFMGKGSSFRLLR